MIFTPFRVSILIVTLLVSASSYAMGRGGYDFAAAVTQSRCSAGAFIAHTKAPSELQSDSHSEGPTSSGSQAGGAGYAPVTLAPVNLIPNGALEAHTGQLPTSWSYNSNGGNHSAFTVVAGQDSATAVRVTNTQSSGSTATWYPPDIKPTPGAYYQYSDVYRSNVSTRAVLMFRDTAGHQQFFDLDTVPPAAQWTTYTQRFFVPTNVAAVVISHPLDQIGWLETDNYRLSQTTAPAYEEGIVSVTFDDGWRSIHTNALPLLKQYNVVSTQYLISGLLGQDKDYMTAGQIYDFTKLGHEVASHTFDHSDLTQLSGKKLAEQLNLPKEGLSRCFEPTTDFAPPYGASSIPVTDAVKAVYQTSRSTEMGFNSADTLDPYRLKVQNVRGDTSPQQIQSWLATTQANRVWLILVYHQVDTGGGEYARRPADFESDLRSITTSGLKITTVHDAYAQIAQAK